ncbi:hypothetical protein FACS1894123_10420 [Bacteroidia bacterium]|nr:hypothetical protein FACS1894123_10420 [Bacteroidia bacterium]
MVRNNLINSGIEKIVFVKRFTYDAKRVVFAYKASNDIGYRISVSENTPSIMPDGRILYTRWEYVDKGAVSENLAKVHDKIKLTPAELLKITNWIDTNAQYYGTYYGRRDIAFKDHPDYRKEYDVEVACSPEPPESYK